jgi:arylsulfatase A-like enzyme
MGRAPRPYDRGHSMLVYEEAIHVPLFFIHPQLPSRTVEMTCKLADIFPTLMACEGLPPPAGVDGHSLAGIYPSQPLFARSIVWWPLAAIAGSFKLVLNEPGGTPELFNLAADPSETTDIAETDAETTTALMRALIRYSCDRFKNDASFDYGFQFLPTGNTRKPARPNINDLLIKK